MKANITILEGKDPKEVLAACYAMLRDDSSIGQIGRSMPEALLGNAQAIDRYVNASDCLVHQLLRSIHFFKPDLVVQKGSAFVLLDAKRHPADYSLEVLELGTFEVPFSSWVAHFGPRAGALLFWVSRVREALPAHEPLLLPRGGTALHHWDGIDRNSVRRFIALVQAELQSRHQFLLPLLRVKVLLGLTATELGALFGVSRQAATAWLQKGAPASRLPKLQTILSIAELLERKLKEGRVPAIVRKPAKAYGGSSILAMIEADRQDEVLDRVRDSFDWAAAA